MEREPHCPLQALMLRLADGDRSAFEAAYELLWPILQQFTQRVLAGSPEAEDAAQEALLKVFARAAQFDRNQRALPWILSIAAYECKTQRQRQRRSKLVFGIDAELASHALDPEASAVARDLEVNLHELLQTLGPGDAETLRALLDEKRPDVPGPTFRKRLARALARLRTNWSTRHGLD